ncbi:terminase large subunit [Vibrio phage 1.111.B._10N.286.45.E6]|nr:terminase large subunit [Vibrio phage 1.111.A._10N.286.45.E6]AUR88269.1 terminase large subunit [Vibrio phage 1.111.B._10N.286.45.E6]
MFADSRKLKVNTAAFIRPPERVVMQEAAERYLKVKGGGGHVPWSPDKTPYMIEPMNCMNSRDYHSTAFKGPARTGKTAALILAPIAHSMACEPADIMVVHMTEKQAERLSKVEIEPMFKADSTLKQCLSPISRDNNVLLKKFKAGNILEIAYPVDSTFRGKSLRYVLVTDYDAVPNPPEGDIFTLSRKRTASYQSLGMTMCESSPGHDCTDLDYKSGDMHESAPAEGIATIYMSGDRRRWYWQCPDLQCKEWFIPEFEYLVFDRDEVDPVKAGQGVTMQCPHCSNEFSEKLKNKLNKGGKWLKQGQYIDSDGVIFGDGLKSKTASFWLPGPAAAFASWGENFVGGYVNAMNAYRLTGDESKLQAFYNVDCGRVYIPQQDHDFDVETLESNRRALPLGVVPEEAKALFASVDVQGGKHRRFVVQIQSMSDGKIMHVVDRFNITHITIGGREVEVRPDIESSHWQALIDRVLNESWSTESGKSFKVVSMAFDTNGEPGVTDRAKEFYKANKAYRSRLMPVKGASSEQEKLVEISKPNQVKRSFKTRVKTKNGGMDLYLLNTNKLKDIVTANMQLPSGANKSITYSSELTDAFFSELQAEKRDAKGKWQKIGSRANEAFDCCAYIWAILVLHKWDQIEEFGDTFKSFQTEVKRQPKAGVTKLEF